MYPSTIIDDFFPNPDLIVDFALQQEYFDYDDTSWPGKRTRGIQELDSVLFNYIGNRLLSHFYVGNTPSWCMDIKFQLTEPFVEDQYHPKNRGWIHSDDTTIFGGVIFLNKTPEEDTGTSLYRAKKGYYEIFPDTTSVKEKFYSGDEVSDEEYSNAFYKLHDQFEETVTVKNVYNRALLFNSLTLHGVKTFGKNQPRLTIPFFCLSLGESPEPVPPTFRYK